MKKANGARPTSQPKPPENGKIETKADIDTRSSSKKAQASSEFSAHKTSFEDALPKGYWGPRGKSTSTSTEDLAARPQPSKPVHRVVLNEHLSNESREMSARSHVCDVSDCPEPVHSGMTTPKAKTRAQAPAKKLVQNSESAEKNSIKVKPPTRNGQKCHDHLGKNLGNANKFLWDVFENNVRLKMDDISHNTSILDRLKVFLDDVTRLDPTFPVYKTGKSLICTGSYYEKLKVCRPNEFDIMIMLDVEPSVFILEWERSPTMEGYVKLKIPSAMQKSRWSAFMTDDGNYLSPIKIRKHFLELLKKVTKSAGEMKTVKVEEHGPAVQVTFTDKKSGKIDAEADMVLCVGFPNAWPQHAIVEKHGMLPTVLEKLKRKGFHVVPKTFESDDKTWRVSYSGCEKYLLLRGQIKCKAKNVLKFVKFLREKHERLLPGLNSYHLKNIFLELAFGSKTWLSKLENKDNFMASVINMLSALLDALEKGKLCHFFNSRCNLLLQLPRGDQEKSIETIEWMLTLLRSNDEEQIKKMIPSL